MSVRNRMIAVTLAAAAALAIAQVPPATTPAATPAAPPASAPVAPAGGVAPDAAQPPQPGQPQPNQPQAVKLSPQELDQLTAPVALYPDALLSQVLMASTYPLEVVQARRWTDANPNIQGDALAAGLEQQTWDPSVKSLVTTPTVLQLMDDKIDWTVKLGDAFLAQQPDVMDSVQRLRVQAQAAGYLKDSEQLKVATVPVEPQPAPQATYYDNGAPQSQPQPVTQYVTIEDTQPDYVYVPVYDPVVVYGGWAYSSYRPFFWHPYRYQPTRGLWYDRPCHTDAAWSYAWGRPDWRVRRLELDVSRAEHEAHNARIERDQAYIALRQRDREIVQNRQRERDRATDDARTARSARTAQANATVDWQHDTAHRRGVSYRDTATAQRFAARPTSAGVAQDAARGRTNPADSANTAGPQRAAATPTNITPTPRRAVIPEGRAAGPARPDRSDAAAGNHARPDSSATPQRGAEPSTPTPAPTPRPRERSAASGDTNAGDTAKAAPTPAPRQPASATPTPAPRQAAPAPTPAPAPRPAAPAPAPRQAAPTPAPAPAPAPRPVQPAPAPRQDAPSRGSAPERPAPTPAPAPAADRGGDGNRGGSSSSSGGSSRTGGDGGGRSGGSGRSK